MVSALRFKTLDTDLLFEAQQSLAAARPDADSWVPGMWELRAGFEEGMRAKLAASFERRIGKEYQEEVQEMLSGLELEHFSLDPQARSLFGQYVKVGDTVIELCSAYPELSSQRAELDQPIRDLLSIKSLLNQAIEDLSNQVLSFQDEGEVMSLIKSYGARAASLQKELEKELEELDRSEAHVLAPLLRAQDQAGTRQTPFLYKHALTGELRPEYQILEEGINLEENITEVRAEYQVKRNAIKEGALPKFKALGDEYQLRIEEALGMGRLRQGDLKLNELVAQVEALLGDLKEQVEVLSPLAKAWDNKLAELPLVNLEDHNQEPDYISGLLSGK